MQDSINKRCEMRIKDTYPSEHHIKLPTLEWVPLLLGELLAIISVQAVKPSNSQNAQLWWCSTAPEDFCLAMQALPLLTLYHSNPLPLSAQPFSAHTVILLPFELWQYLQPFHIPTKKQTKKNPKTFFLVLYHSTLSQYIPMFSAFWCISTLIQICFTAVGSPKPNTGTQPR